MRHAAILVPFFLGIPFNLRSEIDHIGWSRLIHRLPKRRGAPCEVRAAVVGRGDIVSAG